eukprot:scaffold62794_cov34-Tisochrysis_lutea.AAC.1
MRELRHVYRVYAVACTEQEGEDGSGNEGVEGRDDVRLYTSLSRATWSASVVEGMVVPNVNVMIFDAL